MPSPRIVYIDGHEYRVQTPVGNAEHSGHYIDVYSGTREQCQEYSGRRGWGTAVEGESGGAAVATAPALNITDAAKVRAEKLRIDPATAKPHPKSGVIGVPQINAAAKEQGKL